MRKGSPRSYNVIDIAEHGVLLDVGWLIEENPLVD